MDVGEPVLSLRVGSGDPAEVGSMVSALICSALLLAWLGWIWEGEGPAHWVIE